MNAATDELRRLLRAGAPADGNLEPLYLAMLSAEVLVHGFDSPMGPDPLIISFASNNSTEEKFSVQAFTDRQEGVAFGCEYALVPMALKAACKFAAFHSVDHVDIDPGSYGYRLNYAGIIDLLSCRAPRGENCAVQIQPVAVSYWIPDAPPPDQLMDQIRNLATKRRVQRLSWCFAVVGEAPAQLCFAYEPFPNDAFALSLLEIVNTWFKGKMTFTTCDFASRPAVSIAESLQPLISLSSEIGEGAVAIHRSLRDWFNGVRDFLVRSFR